MRPVGQFQPVRDAGDVFAIGPCCIYSRVRGACGWFAVTWQRPKNRQLRRGCSPRPFANYPAIGRQMRQLAPQKTLHPTTLLHLRPTLSFTLSCPRLHIFTAAISSLKLSFLYPVTCRRLSNTHLLSQSLWATASLNPPGNTCKRIGYQETIFLREYHRDSNLRPPDIYKGREYFNAELRKLPISSGLDHHLPLLFYQISLYVCYSKSFTQTRLCLCRRVTQLYQHWK